jgi:hypothetical protein
VTANIRTKFQKLPLENIPNPQWPKQTGNNGQTVTTEKQTHDQCHISSFKVEKLLPSR